MEEKLFFKSQSGARLCGILSNPTRDTAAPIIVLAHGFSSSKASPTYTSLQDSLNKIGIATFRFDFFGHGESEGLFEDITVSEAVDDILSAIAFVKSLGYKKIGLFGSSFGGIASILFASKTSDLYLMALKSPVSDFREVLELKFSKSELQEWKSKGSAIYTTAGGKSNRLNYSFFEDSASQDCYSVASNIKIPVLIVHGDSDETVPIGQSKKIAALMPHCKLEVVNGADHRYSKKEDFEKVIKLVSDFVKANS